MSSQSTTRTNEPKKKTRHEIAMELEPTIADLGIGIIKIMTIMREVQGDYFDRFTRGDEEGNFCILHEFPHMGVLVNIISDYLVEMEKLQKVLEDYIYQD